MVSESETGVVLPYEQQAIAGEELPEGLQAPDQLLFLSLRMLYWQKRLGFLDRKTAVKEKKKLLESYQQFQFHNDVMMHAVRSWKLSELAVSEYRRHPTIENADRVLEILYGVKRKET